MTCGVGTSLGVALVTLALHRSVAHLRPVDAPHIALAVLTTAAVLVLLYARLCPATPATPHAVLWPVRRGC
jgi:hypothetical protein